MAGVTFGDSVLSDECGFIVTEHGVVGVTYDYDTFLTLYFVREGRLFASRHSVNHTETLLSLATKLSAHKEEAP